jgi:hypothetical protein
MRLLLPILAALTAIGCHSEPPYRQPDMSKAAKLPDTVPQAARDQMNSAPSANDASRQAPGK